MGWRSPEVHSAVGNKKMFEMATAQIGSDACLSNHRTPLQIHPVDSGSH